MTVLCIFTVDLLKNWTREVSSFVMSTGKLTIFESTTFGLTCQLSYQYLASTVLGIHEESSVGGTLAHYSGALIQILF